jgi:hypothetical protein
MTKAWKSDKDETLIVCSKENIPESIKSFNYQDVLTVSILGFEKRGIFIKK